MGTEKMTAELLTFVLYNWPMGMFLPFLPCFSMVL